MLGCWMRYLSAKRYGQILNYLTANFLAQEAIYPFYASLKITHKCKFRCKFCNVWKEKTPDISKEDAFKVLDNLGNSSIILLSFEGGDPLLRPDMLELLEYAHNKPFYKFITTSERKLENYPLEEYSKYLDFLHISVDEGHKNLFMLDKLPDLTKRGMTICVQIVVTKDDVGALESKVKRIYDAGAKTVIMPAVHLDDTDDFMPETDAFRKEIFRLKRLYPATITTPDLYLQRMHLPHACNTASIIIDSDGGVFYPCRTIGEKPFNLLETPLNNFLVSEKAKRARARMAACTRHCLWYQYFAANAFVSPVEVWSALRPYFSEILAGNPNSSRGCDHATHGANGNGGSGGEKGSPAESC